LQKTRPTPPSKKTEKTQIELLAIAFGIALTAVSVLFFIFALIKAPAIGVLKISVAVLSHFTAALWAGTLALWLALNVGKPTRVS
jgi:hypothetical protein